MQSPPKYPPFSAAALLQARLAYQAGMLAHSEALCRQVLAIEPDQLEATYLLAAVQASGGRWQEALANFDKALAIKPNFPEALANRGIALGRLGRLVEAIDSFRKALACKPDFAEASYNYGNVLFELERFEESAAQYERALALNPKYAEALYGHGNASREMHRDQQALDSYQKFLAIKPNDAEGYNGCGIALQRLKRSADAVTSFDRAISIKPDFADALCNRGTALQELGRFEEALDDFDKAMALRPDFTEARFNKGLLCLILGRQEEARNAFQSGISSSPRRADFYLSLTTCKRFTADDPLIPVMEDLAQDEKLDKDERIKIRFALGKALRDSGQFDRAFDHVSNASTLKRSHLVYGEGPALAFFEHLRAIFSGSVMTEKWGSGYSSRLPVFIIGMPRSGTTLVEQILSSHQKVFGAGEIEDFKRAISHTFDHFPVSLEDVPAQQLFSLGQRYIDCVRLLAPAAERITDKSTQNWPFVGFINLALPNARIVHVRRDPLDTCLSAFFTLFAEGQAHTYDLAELGRHYRAYANLMAHWRSVLPPGVMLEVQYEDIVVDFENQARKIIDHCGLEWNDACLAFHKTRRAVKTASAFQVRQPIYSSSIGHSRRYLPLLQPLIKALGPDLASHERALLANDEHVEGNQQIRRAS